VPLRMKQFTRRTLCCIVNSEARKQPQGNQPGKSRPKSAPQPDTHKQFYFCQANENMGEVNKALWGEAATALRPAAASKSEAYPRRDQPGSSPIRLPLCPWRKNSAELLVVMLPGRAAGPGDSRNYWPSLVHWSWFPVPCLLSFWNFPVHS
jgi:hypothetical protein